MSKLEKNLWIVGGGIAGMAAAAFAIRDCGINGSQIHILDELDIEGGCLDGGVSPIGNKAWVTRGGRMFTDETYSCTWNLFDSIPSLEDSKVSVKQETVVFNKEHVSHAQARLIDNNHKIIDASKLGLSGKHRLELIRVLASTENMIGSKRINEVFSEEFFLTNFWRMWRTTFAFQKWHSAIELRRYFIRFIQEFPRIHTLGGVKRTKYNQYDSMILPLQRWLTSHGVDVRFGTTVHDADFKTCDNGDRYVTALYIEKNNKKSKMELSINDLAFFKNGVMSGVVIEVTIITCLGIFL